MATALHHSAQRPKLVVEEASEGEVREGTEATSAGTRPERLADARGLQGRLERAACPRFGAPLLHPVVTVQEAAHDDKTVAFLLTQSLRQRQAAKRREEEVVEDDLLVEYYSGNCVFLEKLEDTRQSRGEGVTRLLLDSEGADFFQFWQSERLLVDDVIQAVGSDGLVLLPCRGGRT